MRKAIGLGVGVFAALALFSASAQASTTFKPRVGGALGLVPSHAMTDIATGSPTAVTYHGGAVMGPTVTVHTIFWAPSGYAFNPGYEALVKQFLTDTAGASGTSGNVFSVLPQFGQQTGTATAANGTYSIAYDPASDSLDDANPYPASGRCGSPNGVPTCITDAQIQSEIDAVAPKAERGLTNIWFVLLPPSVDECITASACGTNAFAGYHEEMSLGGGVTIYSVIIDPLVEIVPVAGADPQGNPDAEATIDTIAHEAVEAITDPEGTGWEDPNGSEVGDKCEVGPQIGNPLGFAANGSPYNQVIGGHQYLIQEMWSNDDSGCVQRTTQIGTGLPLPEVDLTQFDSTVSGNIASNTAGVKVTVTILRERSGFSPTTTRGALATKVAQASATTNANGAWSLSLAPYAVGDDRDVVEISYSSTSLQPDFITTGSGGDPFNEGGWTSWADLDNGADVTNQNGGYVALGPCFQTGALTVTVGGTAYSGTDTCNTQTDTSTIATGPISAGEAVTVSSLDNRAFTQPQPLGPSLDPLGNERGALVKLTVTLGEPGAQSALISPLADVLPLRRITGFPSCVADLQFGAAGCSGLVPGSTYTMTRARGNEKVRGKADSHGQMVVGPFRGLPPLKGGDVLTLSNGHRALTSVHVARLRAVILGRELVLGPGSRCQPGLYFGPPRSKPSPPSTFAGLTGKNGATLTGRICPSSGSAAGMSDLAVMQGDDRSGGLTETEAADITSTSPVDGETVYGPFTARARADFIGSHGETIASPFPVSLIVLRAGKLKPVLIVTDVNTPAGKALKGLKPGSYDALWTWHDFNGDARTIATTFVEERATGGAAKSPGGGTKKATVDCRFGANLLSAGCAGGSVLSQAASELARLGG
jgi:hypothetical protein